MTEEQELHCLRAAKADPQRFGPLYDRYFGDVFRFLLRRVGGRDLAADLTQQAFLKALLALERYEPRGLPFRAWLYRIALNEALMHFRRLKGRVFIDIDRADAMALGRAIDEAEAPTTVATDQDLENAMARLRPDQALLIELHWFDKLSYAEVGQVLGIGEDAAKMRTHRVLRTLRQYLVPGA